MSLRLFFEGEISIRSRMSTLIQLRNIHKSHGDLVLFDGASAQFASRDKIGVIGRNGAGKTTLCKILLGEDDIDDGEVVRNPQLRLSHVEQKSPFREGETVLEFLTRYTEKEDWRCAKIAGRFQLRGAMLEQAVESLSGGFQTRVKLAAMLLTEPNFLILDEPTNYLDLRTLLLLERFLQDYRGGCLVVSHDREFLKRTCKQTLEIERGEITMFPGDVEAYFAFKEEQHALKERYNKNIEDKRKQLQKFVDRYRVRASTASRAQSKLKQMNRLESIGIDSPLGTARIKIPAVEIKKGVALRCNDLTIGYPDNEVASGIYLEIERGQHVAVLGDNGQGKTTFLRTIAAELDAQGGDYDWGHQLNPGYYAQHVYAALDDKLDVYTQLERSAARDVLPQQILDMAGSFLFRGDEVEKPIRVLSGGERARVCLAGLLLSRRPVLLLDEPTNHLDFETVEALGRALQHYQGTIFFVSHDRTFVNLVATNIVEVKNNRISLYPGDYESYVYQTERELDEDVGARGGPSASADKSAKSGKGDSARDKSAEHKRRKEYRAKCQQLRKKVATAERDLTAMQEERDAIHQHFLENPTDPAPDKQKRSVALIGLLEAQENLWLALQEELDALESTGPDA
jgi:ATP-binding cassette subfamily F protein 3